MAGALGLRLAGPRVYGETRVDDAFMGDGRAAATAADIRRGARALSARGGDRDSSRSAPLALIALS